MRYLGKLCAFILFVIALKFFNDGNMSWWLFMFAFIIVSGFLIGEEGIDDEQVEAMLKPRWYDNAHCMECGYVNKACVCKPVSGRWEITEYDALKEDGTRTKRVINKSFPKGWEDYKATYVEDVGDDGIIDNTDYTTIAMNYRDAEIANKTPEDEENEDIPF